MNTATQLILSKRVGQHTLFCMFALRADGVCVQAYGTHTSYVSDFLVTPEEAAEVYATKVVSRPAVTCCLCGQVADSTERGLCQEHARLVVDLTAEKPLTEAGRRAGWK